MDITNYARNKELAPSSSGFYRRSNSESLAADLDFQTEEGEEAEDLDVPTFLRKGR